MVRQKQKTTSGIAAVRKERNQRMIFHSDSFITDISTNFFHAAYKNYKKTSCKILLLHFIVCNLNLLTAIFISKQKLPKPVIVWQQKRNPKRRLRQEKRLGKP